MSCHQNDWPSYPVRDASTGFHWVSLGLTDTSSRDPGCVDASLSSVSLTSRLQKSRETQKKKVEPQYYKSRHNSVELKMLIPKLSWAENIFARKNNPTSLEVGETFIIAKDTNPQCETQFVRKSPHHR